MRNHFAEEITKLAAENKKIFLLSGDIGNKLFDTYKEKYPERFMNCGVAEANMMGMAAGLALSGYRPIIYTITPFVTTRCFEQIRVDVCYHKQPVIIVGVGSGLCYASLGPTHHSCEDIAIMRMLPEMSVMCPADPYEVRGAIRAALKHNGPVYIRMGKKGEPLIHNTIPSMELGQALTLSDGTDVCLLSTGVVMPMVQETAKKLKEHGLSARVVSFHTVKPLDQAMLRDVFKNFKLVVTFEEHSEHGGLGGSVAEWMTAFNDAKAKLIRMGTTDSFMHTCGDQEYTRKHFGLTSEIAMKRILDIIIQNR